MVFYHGKSPVRFKNSIIESPKLFESLIGCDAEVGDAEVDDAEVGDAEVGDVISERRPFCKKRTGIWSRP
jgi:hypothetical protein